MQTLALLSLFLTLFCQNGSRAAQWDGRRHLQAEPTAPTSPTSPTSPTAPVGPPPPRGRNVFYRSNTRRFPLAARIALFGPGILAGYRRSSELMRDLQQVAYFLCNNEIVANEAIRPLRRRQPSRNSFAPQIQAVAVADSAAGAAAPEAAASPSAAGVTDFETNNQEEGVDEADLVKSDGTYNFAGYGDVLLVWNARTGESLFNETLPAPKQPPPRPRPGPGPRPIPLGGARLSRPIFIRRRARIRSMLLESNRLILFVQGYGQQLREASRVESVFSNAFDTRIMIYDTSKLPNALVLVEQKDIQGSFRDARAIGNNIHVVTTANLNLFRYTRLLRRSDDRYKDLSDAQYRRTATRVARNEVVPKMIRAIVRDVTVDGFPKLARLCLWLSRNTEAVETIFRRGVVNSFVQLTSFDVSRAGRRNRKLKYSIAGSFAPSSWGVTYAVDNMLVFAMQGWNWVPRIRGTGQTTYFLGFRLNGATARPQAIGSTPGYLLNQFSLDIRGGILRVATTIREFWPIRPEPAREGSRRIIWRRQFTTQNQIILLQIPRGRRVNLLREIFRIDNLGKPREVFTAVRFFDKRAYAVTFERTDPLYVVSFDNPRRPKVLGELSITGFSSYLHPINADNTRILAVGQEADERGRALGVQVTIFDAVDPSNPKLAARFPVELDRNVFSSSAATFDFKSFRYVELREEVGILIMPLTIRAPRRSDVGNFDGFKLFDITGSSIRERLEISHVDSNQFYGCYSRARLPQRSFVFSGNVTTLKGHSIIATDLDSGERRWRFEAPRPTNRNECGFW